MSCAAHPDTFEVFACPGCTKRWCRACSAGVGLAAQHRICRECGVELARATPHLSAADTVRDCVRRVITVEATITAAAFAACWAAAFYAGFLAIFYLAALVAYYFAIVRHVADGQSGLPGPSDSTEDWVEIGGFAVRGVLCTLVGGLPLILYVAYVDRHPPVALVVALFVLGQLLVPAILMAILFTNNGLAVLWPVAWVRIIARAPAAYFRFTVLWLGSLCVGAAICAVLVSILHDWAGLGYWIEATVWSLFWFAQAGLVGHFIRQNADLYGW